MADVEELARVGIRVVSEGIDQVTRDLTNLGSTGDAVGARIGNAGSAGAAKFSQSLSTHIEQTRAAADIHARAFEQQFQADQARIAEGLARGFINRQQARAAGVDAAREFNAGVLSQLDRLGGAGLNTGNSAQYSALAGSLKSVEVEAARTGITLNTLRSSMTTIASSALNAVPGVTQLSSALGGMALGAGPMIAILAGIAAVTYAYDYLTARSREAVKAQEESTRAAEKWAEIQARGVAGERTKQLDDELAKLKDLTAEYTRARAASQSFYGGGAGAGIGVQYGAIGRDQTGQQLATSKRTIATLEADINKTIGDAINDRASLYVRDLANLVKNNAATAAERGKAVFLLNDFQTQLSGAAKGASPELRNNLVEWSRALKEALTPSSGQNFAKELQSALDGLRRSIEPGNAALTAFDDRVNSVRLTLAKAPTELRTFNTEVARLRPLLVGIESTKVDLAIERTLAAMTPTKVDDLTAALHAQQVEWDNTRKSIIGLNDASRLAAFDAMRAKAEANAQAMITLTPTLEAAEQLTKQLGVTTLDAAKGYPDLTDAVRDQTAALIEEIQKTDEGSEAHTRATAALHALNAAIDANVEKTIAAARKIAAEKDAAFADALKRTDAETKAGEASAKAFGDPIRSALRSMQHDVAGFFEDVFTHGIRSFDDLADHVRDIFTRLIADLVALKIGQRVADTDLFKNLLGSAGSLGPKGTTAGISNSVWSDDLIKKAHPEAASDLAAAQSFALAGVAVIGFASALNNLTGAVNKTAQQLDSEIRSRISARLSLEDYRRQTLGSPIEQQLAQSSSAAQQQRDQIEAAFGGRRHEAERNKLLAEVDAIEAAKRAQIAKDFWDGIGRDLNALRGPAGDLQNQLDALAKTYADNMAAAEALGGSTEKVKALYEAQKAAAIATYEEGQRQLAFSLDAREAYAKGLAFEGDLITRRADEDRQRFEAEQAGWSTADKTRLAYILSLEDERDALARLRDARQTLAESTAAGRTGTLQSQQAAGLQPLLDRQADDQRAYDATHAALLKQLDDDTKRYTADLAAQADATTIAADEAAIAADKMNLQTQETIKLGDAAAIAARQFADSIALVNQAVSDIQQGVSLGFVSDAAGLAQEQQAFGFGGLSIDQIRALFTTYDPNNPLTNEQRETNRRIQQFLGDYDRVNGTLNGLPKSVADAISNTAAVQQQSGERDAVAYAARSIDEPTANRLADYAASSYREAHEQTGYLRDILRTLGGQSTASFTAAARATPFGGIPDFAQPIGYTQSSAQAGPIGDIAAALATRTPPAPSTAPTTIVKQGDTYEIHVHFTDSDFGSMSPEARKRFVREISEDIAHDLAAVHLANGDATLLGH